MKKPLWILLLVTVCLGTSVGLAQDANEDAAAIGAVVRDYIEGWYGSDPARVQNAMHPNLQKATVRSMSGSDTEYLDIMEAGALVAYAGQNQKWVEGKEGLQEIRILYQEKKIAVVRAVSSDFVDLCSLIKMDGKWKILQVVWEMKEEG